MTMHIIIIQKDNNDSEAMERHHHDMELLCACLLKPRTEILKKNSRERMKHQIAIFPATETKHTILGWPMDVPQLPCFTWLHPWHKVPNSKIINHPGSVKARNCAWVGCSKGKILE